MLCLYDEYILSIAGWVVQQYHNQQLVFISYLPYLLNAGLSLLRYFEDLFVTFPFAVLLTRRFFLLLIHPFT